MQTIEKLFTPFWKKMPVAGRPLLVKYIPNGEKQFSCGYANGKYEGGVFRFADMYLKQLACEEGFFLGRWLYLPKDED